jgi:hypothetical protein
MFESSVYDSMVSTACIWPEKYVELVPDSLYTIVRWLVFWPGYLPNREVRVDDRLM